MKRVAVPRTQLDEAYRDVHRALEMLEHLYFVCPSEDLRAIIANLTTTRGFIDEYSAIGKYEKHLVVK